MAILGFQSGRLGSRTRTLPYIVKFQRVTPAKIEGKLVGGSPATSVDVARRGEVTRNGPQRPGRPPLRPPLRREADGRYLDLHEVALGIVPQVMLLGAHAQYLMAQFARDALEGGPLPAPVHQLHRLPRAAPGEDGLPGAARRGNGVEREDRVVGHDLASRRRQLPGAPARRGGGPRRSSPGG